MANTYLQRSTTTRTNNQAYTFSCWFKRSALVSGRLCINYLDGNNRGYISIQNENKMFCYDKVGGTEIDSRTSEFTLRDVNGWYHYVQSVNNLAGGSGGSLSDRFKTYLNGVDVSGYWTVGTSMGYNVNLGMQAVSGTNGFKIGSQEAGSDNWNGSMSHVHFVDGLQLPASTFGSTDATTGEWKINSSPTISNYGNNGFFILKDSNSVTDQSGKGNNFTVGGGTLTKTEDCPDNVFATMNPLNNYFPNFNLANGNTSVEAGNGARTYLLSTMGLAPTGKYYWEIKLQGQSNGASSNSVLFGISQKSTDSTSEDLTDGVASSTVIDGSGRVYVEGSLAGTFGSSYEPSTVMCLAYDAVNNKMYFGKDGTWLNSGDPTSGSTGTGAFTPTATNGAYNNIYMPCWGVNYNHAYSSAFNFGNGYFNTTAVASAGTNASGNGIFEHNVPSGYTALSTKGLNL